MLYFKIIFSFNNISLKKSEENPFIFCSKIIFPKFSNSLSIFFVKNSFGICSRISPKILKNLDLFIITKLSFPYIIFEINLRYSTKLFSFNNSFLYIISISIIGKKLLIEHIRYIHF